VFGSQRQPKKLDKKALGAMGERMAARELRRSGYKILGRNIDTPVGEADIVCRAPDRSTIVVVEVKTRAVDADNPRPIDAPELAVGPKKKRTLVAISRSLAGANGWTDRPMRIDVVAVVMAAGTKPTIRHHINAVTLDDVR